LKILKNAYVIKKSKSKELENNWGPFEIIYQKFKQRLLEDV